MAEASKKKPAAEPAEDVFLQEELVETEVWEFEATGPDLITRMMAEAIGTFILVLMGVGAALLAAYKDNGSLTVGLSFGVAVMIGVVIFGATSGAHFNPAVTVGVWLSGRFPGRDVLPYILAQVIGGALATGGIALAIKSIPQITWEQVKGFMSTASLGFGDHAPLASQGLVFGIGVAIAVEVVATALLTAIVLGATSARAPRGIAPFAIGLALALLVVWVIPFTNGALNPARATATAIFSDTWALKELWVFWLAPVLGAAIAGLLYRAFGPEEDFESVEVVELEA